MYQNNCRKLKNKGVLWIFVDEVSMIASKVWSVIRGIKNIFGFKFALLSHFYQLPSVESKHYGIVNSDIINYYD